MGLDLDLISKECFLNYSIDDLSVDDETKSLLKDLVNSGDHEKAIATLSLVVTTQEDKLTLNLYKHLYDPWQRSFRNTDEYEEWFKKYGHLMNDEELWDTKLGSYSALHYLRFFCDQVTCLFHVNKDTPTREYIASLLRAGEYNDWAYDFHYCPALCNHSDCDGVYLPTIQAFDYNHGSAVRLMRELDRVYSTGAVDILKELEVDNWYAESILWSFNLLLRYMLLSLYYDEILVFC